ncbi:MAG: class B sortase [Lachnospiraceae bacterium]|nr:class B sortase [Lachnospiraceae bacterium]
MRKTINIIIGIIALAVFLFCGYKLFGIYEMYHQAENAYDEVEALVEENITDQAGADTEEKPGDFPKVWINLDPLLEINQDVKGWFYLGDLDISYPIMQGEDNDYYLHRDIYEEYSKPGSIFLDAGASDDYSDLNTIVYGHNMKNGSMFGTLKTFYQDEEFGQAEHYFYIYTGDTVRQYQVFAYEEVSPTDTLYEPVTAENYDAYLQEIQSKALRFTDPATLSSEQNMIMLSTCYGDGSKRFLVHGIFVSEKEK